VGVFQPAVHRAIVIVDVENFGDPARTNEHQLAVREGMYEALRQSFVQAGISWAACVAEDRGDGVLVMVPPEVPKGWLVTRVPVRLAEILAVHNVACLAQERIRLRMALHAGEVHRDAHGWAGVSVNRAFRLTCIRR
jgi:class 3 adenylate cyclase